MHDILPAVLLVSIVVLLLGSMQLERKIAVTSMEVKLPNGDYFIWSTHTTAVNVPALPIDAREALQNSFYLLDTFVTMAVRSISLPTM
jgi:hypothetical protein